MEQIFQFVHDQRVVSKKKAVLIVDLRLMGLSRWEARNCISDEVAYIHFVTSGRSGLRYLSYGGVQKALNRHL